MDDMLEAYMLRNTADALYFCEKDKDGNFHVFFFDKEKISFLGLLGVLCASDLVAQSLAKDQKFPEMMVALNELFLAIAPTQGIGLGYFIIDAKKPAIHWWAAGASVTVAGQALVGKGILLGLQKRHPESFEIQTVPFTLGAPISFEMQPGQPIALDLTVPGGENAWSFSLRLGKEALKRDSLLATLSDFFKLNPALNEHRSMIYTVLTELYSNALEHGVLKITSGLKDSAEGIIQYYDERQHKLEDLEEGFIHFSLSYQKNTQKKLLQVTLEDSGAGFDHEALHRKLDALDMDSTAADLLYHGRGLRLIKSFCETLVHELGGRKVSASINLSTKA